MAKQKMLFRILGAEGIPANSALSPPNSALSMPNSALSVSGVPPKNVLSDSGGGMRSGNFRSDAAKFRSFDAKFRSFSLRRFRPKMFFQFWLACSYNRVEGFRFHGFGACTGCLLVC